jgi:hypothetical protein
MTSDPDPALLRSQIAEGKRLVNQQRALIAQMHRENGDVYAAALLLGTYEQTLAELERRLAALEK